MCDFEYWPLPLCITIIISQMEAKKSPNSTLVSARLEYLINVESLLTPRVTQASLWRGKLRKQDDQGRLWVCVCDRDGEGDEDVSPGTPSEASLSFPS